MKRYVAIFAALVLLSAGVTVYGWAFAGEKAGEAHLAEVTLEGSREAAAGLVVSFRADSSDDLHWINSFDFSTGEGKSSFRRGEMQAENDASVYDEIRFKGSSVVPFVTRLAYGGLAGLQERKIQEFYDGLQQKVLESGAAEKGRIRLCDYLDFYPVSFSFQFGTKLYDSDAALTGLRVYEQQSKSAEEGEKIYAGDIELYTAFNEMFRIPVIDNEYQEYEISVAESEKQGTSPDCETAVAKPLGEGEDFFEFEPLIVIQEENILDGKNWRHADASGAAGDEAAENGGADKTDGRSAAENAGAGTTDGTENNGAGTTDGRSAAKNGLKNRMLFAFNNRTAKGAAVDVSRLKAGYGIYELPFEIVSNATIRKTPKSRVVVNPQPLADEIKLVYPLNEKAEYVEMSMSEDHRYLAVFSVLEGAYFAEMIDADSWTPAEPIKLFPAAEKMTYAWGEDGSLAASDHRGNVTILARTENADTPYEVVFSGQTENGFDGAFFDAKTDDRGATYAAYECCADKGLVLTVKDGKAALAQNLLVGEPEDGLRNAALECAVIDKSGVLYRGIIKSDVVDIGYDADAEETAAIKKMLGASEASKADLKAAELMIRPIRSANRIEWTD